MSENDARETSNNNEEKNIVLVVLGFDQRIKSFTLKKNIIKKLTKHLIELNLNQPVRGIWISLKKLQPFGKTKVKNQSKTTQN